MQGLPAPKRKRPAEREEESAVDDSDESEEFDLHVRTTHESGANKIISRVPGTAMQCPGGLPPSS